MRRIIAGLIALAFLLSASSAWAIQGYKDRHGFFVGGGPGAVHHGDDAFETGIERGGAFGFAPHLVIGGGATDNLVFGAELNNWIHLTDVHSNRVNHQQWSANAMANIFIVHGLYLDAGLGLGYAFTDTVTASGETSRHQELGLSTKLGLGIEYFLDGTIAAGMRFGYTRHFYRMVDFDTLVGNVYLRWY